ncbi:MAG: hypothetical protein JW768_00110 [Chitinispirillaceae bacterium]|nr:hypothetical protein [Chitinispirillaceae bacterium]
MNRTSASMMLFATGFSAASLQILFFREYLSIFSGNELVTGIIFSLWLLAAAVGSYFGARLDWWNQNLLTVLYVFSVLSGIIILRALRLLFEPGEVIGPWYIPLIVAVTQTDAAFFSGLVYGKLSKAGCGQKLYLFENIGALFGLFMIAAAVMTGYSNGTILAFICGLFGAYVFLLDFYYPTGKVPWLRMASIAMIAVIIAGFMALNPVSVKWKYSIPVDTVVNGRSGEIVVSRGAADTTLLLNGRLYRSSITLPVVEQAVHLPLSMRSAGLPSRALVINNNGHVAQLEKYQSVDIKCMVTEPLVAHGKCAYGTIEKNADTGTFDLVLLAAGMPTTIESCRFFTEQFFARMLSYTSKKGVFSFTLPFSENFLTEKERALKNILLNTLKSVYKHVMVIPGNGYTFVASNSPLSWPVSLPVKTEYLEHFTIPLISNEKIVNANKNDCTTTKNYVNKPAALLLAQQQWLGLFGYPISLIISFLILLGIASMAFISKTRGAVSVGTTGFVAGMYSIVMLLIFQFYHGSLYEKISLLMIALTGGFVIGAMVKKWVFADSIIALYAPITILFIAKISFPPLWLFMLLNGGIGFLSGAQFVTRKNEKWGSLYSADLAGGVIGMALCSTVLLPVIGLHGIALMIGFVKIVSVIVSRD